MIYNWYLKIEKNSQVEQGDFIQDCPIIVPPEKLEEGGEYSVEIITANCIILSQSCDIMNEKITNVVVCPYYEFKDFCEQENIETLSNKKGFFKDLKNGRREGLHLLNKSEELGINDYLVVDFKNVYGVNIKFLKDFGEKTVKRIRLLPPYREHLAQAFARFFMRVGLPQDIGNPFE